MAGSTADIDITPQGFEALLGFGSNQYAVANLEDLREGVVRQSQSLPASKLPAGQHFRTVANTSAEDSDKFLNNVELGFKAFREGAAKMAASYSALDHQLALTMNDVAIGQRQPES